MSTIKPTAMGSGTTGTTSLQLQQTINKSPIVLQNWLKKLKTMKKKYFVLYRDTINDGGLARLEYYDNDKKFKSRAQPKRKILLNTVQINRRLDTKHKYVIAFQTKNDCFCIVLDSESELSTWLRACIALQKGEEIEEDPPKTTFEHVWQVHVQRKGLAEEKGIVGNYHLCLTEKSLALIRIGLPTTPSGEQRMPSVEFLLMTIRRCGNTQIFFYLEVGRHSAIGSGELWMETEDSLIAQNMHLVIINAMTESNKNRDDYMGPISRNRSSSATESSKPIPMLQRRQTHTGNKPLNLSFSPSGGTVGRERCDSLPSRNRTTSDSSNQSIHTSVMPPSRLIHPNRPHSIPSGACSESDGSSLSIDETDGMNHSMTPDDSVIRYIGSLPQGTVIPEENVEEYWYNESTKPNNYEKTINSYDKWANNASLSLPLSQIQTLIQRKGSPAPRVGSVEGSNSYMEMYSPCGSSPGDPAGNAYIPMSPGVEFSRGGIYTGSSGAHSRASSLAEETIDGYVHMNPPQPEEYVDMDPTHRHHPTNSMSSAASSCSITSGTPSTDMRFAEYHLDKVSTRFTPDNEDTSSMTERPIRAYSVGSKLEFNKRKLRVTEPNRIRAYSVGSRANKVPKSESSRGQLAPSEIAILNSKHNNHHNVRGKKSSSAPILSIKNPSSIDPMDDLMEIDYSKKDDNCSTPTGIEVSTSLPKTKTNDLMEIDFSIRKDNRYSSTPMKASLPVPVPNKQRYDNKMNISPKNMNRYPEYVEMRPQIHASDPVAIAQKRTEEDGYLNMRPVSVTSINKSPSLSSSPVKSIMPKTVPLTASSFSSSYSKNPIYMDTSSSRSLEKISSSPKIISNDYLDMRPGGIDYTNSTSIDLSKTVSAPEGYMEMSWGKENKTNNNNNNKNTTIIEKPFSDEYIDMNFSRQEPRLTSSLPITIQNCRYHETNPPQISTFLQLQQNSSSTSPGKISSRVRCDSKDSGIVTPSGSQAAIFPFSPSSPMKNFMGQNIDSLDANTLARKCLVDGTTGTIRLSEEDERQYNEPPRIIDPTKILNTDYPSTAAHLEALCNNYADMTIGNNRKTNIKPIQQEEPSDYVNYAPAGQATITTTTKPISVNTKILKINDDASGDYAFVDPKKINIIKKSPLVTINANQDKMVSYGGFKPIASNADELVMRNTNYVSKAGSPKPTVNSVLNRQLSEKRYPSVTRASDLPVILNAVSRPKSVNSEKITTKTTSNCNLNRPNSANSDRLPVISSSSSSSTLCGSSSSSTLCGSKCQSPSTSVRPQSLGDIGIEPIEGDNIAISRPPSVSSERELHYASLDLPPTTSNRLVDINNDNVKNNSIDVSSSASPSPNKGGPLQPPAFTYAQIDFVKTLKMENI